MRGMPKYIKTPADLDNLFALAQTGEIDKAELAEKINALLSLQYYQIPILSTNGNAVTTRYFSEVSTGDTTIDGLTVEAAAHTETPPEDEPGGTGTEFAETVITLSEPLAAGTTTLSVYKPVNYLTQHGFDVQDINNKLEVLA